MVDYRIGNYDIKEVQAVMAKMMQEIHQVCEKNNIRYILDGGTMLGAVRHKGFIPWDDDLDIAMPRDDYEKFIAIANMELGSQYKFECMENTHEYPYNFGKVRAIDTLYAEEFTASLKINHGVYIDVFPMDYVNPDDKKRLSFIQKNIAHFTMLRYAKLGLISGIKYKPFMLLSNHFFTKWLRKLMMYDFQERGAYVQKLCHFGKNKPPVSLDLFNNVIYVPFEEYQFRIPKEYDSFLTGRYGNYMKLPPQNEQKPVHTIKEIRL